MTLAQEGSRAAGGRPPQPPSAPPRTPQPPSQPPPQQQEEGGATGQEPQQLEPVLLDKVARRKLKKLRRKIRNGQVSRAQAEECAKHGMVVRAEAEWAPEMVEGKRGSLGPADLRQAILHVLTAGSAARCPSWLRLVNGGLLGGVVVVGLAGVDPSYLKDNLSQLPFLAACTRPMPLRLYHGPHPRRSIFSLLFYRPKEKEKRKLMGAGRPRSDSVVSGCLPNGGEDEEEEEAEEEEDDDLAEEDAAAAPQCNGAGNGSGSLDEEEEEDDKTVSVEPFEQYVLGLNQLKLAGFPLPPEDLAGRIRRRSVNRTNMAAERGGGKDDDDNEDDDIGCPVGGWLGDGEEAEAAAAVVEEEAAAWAGRAWLERDAEGKWQGTAGGALVPTLEEAQRILATLDGVKVGGLSLCFYETLGGRDSEEEQPPYKMAALDCEMCQTAQGMEVTRLTLVDDQRTVLLDAFVKPYAAITDYHTRFSGITPGTMDKCQTRLEQVQVALLRLVRADTVLVGHSLEQDLLVTGLIHLRCIDTGVLYPHPRGHHCRYALRVLTKKYLNRVIQNAATGHCSKEDAVAALDLVQLKVTHGPSFGTEDGGAEEGEQHQRHTRNRASFLDRLTAAGKRCALLDQSDALVQVVRGGASAVVCRSNEEVLSKAKAQAKQALPPDFVWGSLAAARPLTAEAWESRRKRKLHQQQQQQQQRQHVRPPAASSSSSSSSSSSASLASLASSGSEGRGKRVRLSDLGSSPSTSTGHDAHSPAATHTRFKYEEHILDLVDPVLLRADQQLAELFDALPHNTLLMVVAQPDVALAATLHAQRAAALRPGARATLPWTDHHEDMLKELCGAAQRGLVLLRVR